MATCTTCQPDFAWIGVSYFSALTMRLIPTHFLHLQTNKTLLAKKSPTGEIPYLNNTWASESYEHILNATLSSQWPHLQSKAKQIYELGRCKKGPILCILHHRSLERSNLRIGSREPKVKEDLVSWCTRGCSVDLHGNIVCAGDKLHNRANIGWGTIIKGNLVDDPCEIVGTDRSCLHTHKKPSSR